MTPRQYTDLADAIKMAACEAERRMRVALESHDLCLLAVVQHAQSSLDTVTRASRALSELREVPESQQLPQAVPLVRRAGA